LARARGSEPATPGEGNECDKAGISSSTQHTKQQYKANGAGREREEPKRGLPKREWRVGERVELGIEHFEIFKAVQWKKMLEFFKNIK